MTAENRGDRRPTAVLAVSDFLTDGAACRDSEAGQICVGSPLALLRSGAL